MHHVMILGAGRIGRLISCLLASSGEYKVVLADNNVDHLNKNLFGNLNKSIECIQLDAGEKNELVTAVKKYHSNAIVSCLPFYCNPIVAEAAKVTNIAYFDLTEDTAVTQKVAQLADGADNAFVPQSGLAPGFISIIANHLMKQFREIDAAFLRVGALPVYPNNALKYNLTWSTDGLINECGNPGFGLLHGQEVTLQPLEGLETLQIDGLLYEAFNTSGGLGSLVQSYAGKVQTMNYKSLRYPGHCQAMRLLMNDLKLNKDRETLKAILERAIPSTESDVVIVYVAVRGYTNHQFTEKTYVNKIYPKTIAGQKWTAIQITTAGSACAVLDEVLNHPKKYKGLVKQENFDFDRFIENRFGQVYSQGV